MLNAKQMQELITSEVREALKGSRFEHIMITPEDDDEDVARPSIRTMMDTTHSREMMLETRDTSVELFFYAEQADDYVIDCMEVQELIAERIEAGIMAEDDILQPENMDCSSSGGVLAISFTLQQMQANVTETETDMETLEIGIR